MATTTFLNLPVNPGYPLCDVAGNACHGRQLPGSGKCLAHANTSEKTAYFASLSSGADIDHRGTHISRENLSALRDAVSDGATGQPTIGKASFNQAVFIDPADFSNVIFTEGASFTDAEFPRGCNFTDAAFLQAARFGDTKFTHTQGDSATFRRAVFSGIADFRASRFAANAEFDSSWFEQLALFQKADFQTVGHFSRCVFKGVAEFINTTFTKAVFAASTFERARELGPIVCMDELNLVEAEFYVSVTIKTAAHRVRCERTIWNSSASLLLRYATVHLEGTNLVSPFAVTHAPTAWGGTNAAESTLITAHPMDSAYPKIASLRGVDATHVVLTDTDLTLCQFTGAFHLDQLQLRGRTLFAQPPRGWRFSLRHGLHRWSRRRTLAEEQYWRRLNWPEWQPPIPPSAVQDQPGTEDLTALYRQLRKGLEDAKDEPGAADFYYGEMEMRRHDHVDTNRWVRRLLWLYWAISGYGLRPSRAIACLLTLASGSLLALVLWGLPGESPKAKTTGTLPTAGQQLLLTTDTPDPQLSLPYAQRVTWDRASRAAPIVFNSVVFRSSGESLTVGGTWIEMTTRLVEPAFLGLALLAIRSRVKR
ncbi:pentapeptide repeat-containing protein [Streptomyces hokutonensis]|uniref:pentapeptide repeat-containing protein n=1 Tax=Streptomyces hokutonensis TaxID=1306990 RepID=UPI0003729A17|nr:pentapeptide repeat-containing protein [Streptomyces hokutonensis]